MKGFLEKYLVHARFFYRYLGNRIWISTGASMLVALLDVVGLMMFLPLLTLADMGSGAEANTELGGMEFVLEGLNAIGIPLKVPVILTLMVVFFMLKGVARYLAQYYIVILQQRFSNGLRLENVRLLAGYDYAAFAAADSGRIQNTFSAEVTQITHAYRSYFVMLQHAIMLVVYISLAFIANPLFALLVGIGGVLTNFLFDKVFKATKRASRKLTKEMHKFQGFLIQSVSSFKYLKATNLIDKYRDKIERSILEIEDQQRKVGRMSALSSALREPVVVLIVVIAIAIQLLVLEKSLESMIFSLLLLYRGLNSLNAAQAQYNNFLSVSGSMENMQAFMSDLQANQEVIGEETPEHFTTAIRLQDLSFSYGDREVLSKINLEIEPYETVGLVGESGSGKTTLVNILCGLLKVKPGMLFLNGVDINELDIRKYRSRIGYVTQEAQIFSDTIVNNVSFWEEGAVDLDRVWKALENAHAATFIRELPDGLDTIVGINGINLSGGQRQRISIARELYRAVDLLIMDEATSALDSQSEHYIQQNIEELSGQYTMIIVAHRLSTIRIADKILLLEEGGGHQIGNFKELQQTSSIFNKMVALQTIS